MSKFYPESKVEIQGFEAEKYDTLLDVLSLGWYKRFIRSAIDRLRIREGERILDFGCGTGRNACLMRPHLGDNGYYLGVDISPIMQGQFEKNCAFFNNVYFQIQRIDQSFQLDEPFDRVFISFVLHGFPQEVRQTIIRNAYDNLKPGGLFSILDFAEFSLQDMPFYYRIPFKTVECPYAFDFIEKDWTSILAQAGFKKKEEHFWFKNYIRLLIVEKV